MLYSYIIKHDNGAAPNPFWGICTLVICKPTIRRSAQVGDWIVATGSKNSPIGDISGKAVYIMKITKKMTMKEYNAYTKEYLPQKIPFFKSKDLRYIVGDSIYDFSYNPPELRESVHNEENKKRDLSGKYALLSDYFFYFGNKPIELPDHLKNLLCKTQGHKSKSNTILFNPFLDWVNSLNLKRNKLYGKPLSMFFKNTNIKDLGINKRCMKKILNKTSNKICYLCGKKLEGEIDNDHIPPKQFYAKLIKDNVNLQLFKLPTHKSCNKSFQHDEDYFVHSLAPIAMHTQTGRAKWFDILNQSKRPESKKIIKKVYNEFDSRPSGLILPYGLTKKSFEGDRIRRVIWKITRGLYYKVHKKYLSELTTHGIEIYGPNEKIRDEFSIVRETPSKGDYPDVFDYKFVGTEDYNFWAMLFWDCIVSLIEFNKTK